MACDILEHLMNFDHFYTFGNTGNWNDMDTFQMTCVYSQTLMALTQRDHEKQFEPFVVQAIRV